MTGRSGTVEVLRVSDTQGLQQILTFLWPDDPIRHKAEDFSD
jgi:hypothetical protein